MRTTARPVVSPSANTPIRPLSGELSIAVWIARTASVSSWSETLSMLKNARSSFGSGSAKKANSAIPSPSMAWTSPWMIPNDWRPPRNGSLLK